MHSRRIAAIAAAFGACLLAAGGAGAMTIITLQADGGVSVRIGEEAAVLIPPGTAEALRTGLTPSADPAAVEELLAEGTCAASADARLPAAVASYEIGRASWRERVG